MRSFGRSCRGQGKVFVKLVRQTEQQLLDLGEDIPTLSQQAQAYLEQTTMLSETQRERLSEELTTAICHYEQIRKQSKQLTQGKKLRHFKVVNAYDPSIAPIIKGKSNCPAQFGRKPGIISEPATGFIFEVVASFTSSRTASNLGIERCVKINGLSSGSEAWTGIGVVAGFLAGMGMIESSYMKIHKRPKKFNIIKYYSMLGEL